MPSNDIQIRSDGIQEIVSRRPGFLIRWGIPIFLVILSGIIIGSWFIKYPDIIIANARLNAINPPGKIIAKTTGKLIKLFKGDGSEVKEGDIVGYMETAAKYDEVQVLSALLDTLQYFTDSLRLEELPAYWRNHCANFNNLGELQQAHQSFMQAFIGFKDYLSTGFYVAKKRMLWNDLANTRRLLQTIYNQQSLQQQDLALSTASDNLHDTLHNENLINDIDYRSQKSQFINKKMTVPQMEASIINNQTQQNALIKEMLDLDNQIVQQKSLFVQALSTYRALVHDWKLKYLLIVPAKGTLVFSSFLQEGQQIQQNQIVCYVTNPGSAYFVEMLIPQYNSGKVKIGQEVFLKFESYPYEEFGMVKGNIQFIKSIPTDSGFMSRVDLQNGLVTTNNKQLVFGNGMRARADIITDDIRLSERFFGGLRKLLGK
jgi:multidrug efflux pump subunit AcrA (membrane-fusion protein)